MVHKRSPASLLRRRARAVERGYVRSLPRGFAHVLVQSDLAPAARAVVASLALHRRHSVACETQHHYARMATIHAAREDFISAAEMEHALAIHRTANAAKHDWVSRPSHDACLDCDTAAPPGVQAMEFPHFDDASDDSFDYLQSQHIADEEDFFNNLRADGQVVVETDDGFEVFYDDPAPAPAAADSADPVSIDKLQAQPSTMNLVHVNSESEKMLPQVLALQQICHDVATAVHSQTTVNAQFMEICNNQFQMMTSAIQLLGKNMDALHAADIADADESIVAHMPSVEFVDVENSWFFFAAGKLYNRITAMMITMRNWYSTMAYICRLGRGLCERGRAWMSRFYDVRGAARRAVPAFVTATGYASHSMGNLCLLALLQVQACMKLLFSCCWTAILYIIMCMRVISTAGEGLLRACEFCCRRSQRICLKLNERCCAALSELIRCTSHEMSEWLSMKGRCTVSSVARDPQSEPEEMRGVIMERMSSDTFRVWFPELDREVSVALHQISLCSGSYCDEASCKSLYCRDLRRCHEYFLARNPTWSSPGEAHNPTPTAVPPVVAQAALSGRAHRRAPKRKRTRAAVNDMEHFGFAGA